MTPPYLHSSLPSSLPSSPFPPSKGDQYLTSGDWWSLGVTMVELLSGKKPFKKKFQKYKNTEDKVQVCLAGDVDDPIEERNIEAKLGGAKVVDHDGRDSNDEETDDESGDEGEKEGEKEGAKEGEKEGEKEGAKEGAKKGKRRSAARIIGGFHKMVESNVENEHALELLTLALDANEKLAAFRQSAFEGGRERLLRIMSVLAFQDGTEIMVQGELATFFGIVLDGTLHQGSTVYNVGEVVGYEGLFAERYHRPATITGRQGTLGVFLYAELGRATMYDEPVMAALRATLCACHGGSATKALGTALETRISDLGESEELHPEEGFLMHQRHSHRAISRASTADASLQRDLSSSKQRDQKIYLTQEVWIKKSVCANSETARFLQGLLTRDVNKRLGTGSDAFTRVREHGFFRDGPLGEISWESMQDQSKAAPFIPKKEVNAKDESKMKTFNTAGMQKLTMEDEALWADWDWVSAPYFQDEMAACLYEEWGLHEKSRSKFGSGGCCTVM